MNKTVTVEATPQILGMVRKVNHLVTTEKVKGVAEKAKAPAAKASVAPEKETPTAEKAI